MIRMFMSDETLNNVPVQSKFNLYSLDTTKNVKTAKNVKKLLFRSFHIFRRYYCSGDLRRKMYNVYMYIFLQFSFSVSTNKC